MRNKMHLNLIWVWGALSCKEDENTVMHKSIHTHTHTYIYIKHKQLDSSCLIWISLALKKKEENKSNKKWKM